MAKLLTSMSKVFCLVVLGIVATGCSADAPVAPKAPEGAPQAMEPASSAPKPNAPK